jgi:hypothetical protein
MRLVGVTILAVAGCHTGMAPDADAPIPTSDSNPHALGVFVPWSADPTLPGSLDDKHTVDDITFQLAHFQIISDSASGDNRTTHSHFLLKWDDSHQPQQDAFPDAPEGVYSKVTLDMFGNLIDYAYEIHGTWKDGEQIRRYKIHDRTPLEVSLDCNQTLAAAGSATIAITIDLRDAINSVDYKQLDVDNGVSELGTTDPQIVEFRDKLGKGFKVTN